MQEAIDARLPEPACGLCRRRFETPWVGQQRVAEMHRELRLIAKSDWR